MPATARYAARRASRPRVRYRALTICATRARAFLLRFARPGAVKVDHGRQASRQVQHRGRVQREMRGDQIGAPLPQQRAGAVAHAEEPFAQSRIALRERRDRTAAVHRYARAARNQPAHLHACVGQAADQRVKHAVEATCPLGKPVHAQLQRFDVGFHDGLRLRDQD